MEIGSVRRTTNKKRTSGPCLAVLSFLCPVIQIISSWVCSYNQINL